MATSGPVIHQQLMDAFARLQAEVGSYHNRASSDDNRRSELLDQRSESLRQLAEHYLPDLTEDSIESTWAQVHPSIRQVLQRRMESCDQLEQEIAGISQHRSRQESELAQMDARLDEALLKQDELQQTTEDKLAGDGDFVRLSDQAAKAELALERAEAGLQEIDQDSARKLPAYEESTLFQYLHNQGFGTGQYKKRGFTRRMDRWVGKMIDYNKARQSYEFLKKTPEQMRRLLADDHAAFETVMAELEKRRDEVAEEVGLTHQVQECGRLRSQRSELIRQLEQSLTELHTTQRELDSALDPQGSFHREAIDLFRDMLSRFDTRSLRRQADETIEITDDQIVDRLMGIDSQIDAYDHSAEQERRSIHRKQEFIEDLGRLIQRFRSAEFESSRSQFTESLDLLASIDLATQSGDIERLWNRIRSSQRWGPTTMDQITKVATHPLTQVLLNAMAHAAGAALQSQARRAGNRRRYGGDSWSGPWGGGSSSWKGRRRW